MHIWTQSDTRLRLASLQLVLSEAQSSTRLRSSLLSLRLLISLGAIIFTPRCVCISQFPSLSLSLFAGACGFHQLFRNNVACVSQLQGELLMAPNQPIRSLLWCLWLWCLHVCRVRAFVWFIWGWCLSTWHSCVLPRVAPTYVFPIVYLKKDVSSSHQ